MKSSGCVSRHHWKNRKAASLSNGFIRRCLRASRRSIRAICAAGIGGGTRNAGLSWVPGPVDESCCGWRVDGWLVDEQPWCRTNKSPFSDEECRESTKTLLWIIFSELSRQNGQVRCSFLQVAIHEKQKLWSHLDKIPKRRSPGSSLLKTTSKQILQVRSSLRRIASSDGDRWSSSTFRNVPTSHLLTKTREDIVHWLVLTVVVAVAVVETLEATWSKAARRPLI